MVDEPEETDRLVAAPAPPAWQQPIKFLSKQEVLAITGLSSSLMWELMRDGLFPLPRELGNKPGGNRSKIGWIDAEIYAWMRNRPQRLPGGDAQPPIARASRNKNKKKRSAR